MPSGRTGRRIARRTLAWLASIGLLAAPPATAVDLSLGLQGGLYRPDSDLGEVTNAGFGSPVIDLQAGPFGMTIKYIFASYDTGFSEQRRFSLVDFTGGQIERVDVRSDATGSSDRHDVDMAVRYRTSLDAIGLGLTLFTGLRYELQTLQGSVTNTPTVVGAQPGAEELFESLIPPTDTGSIEIDFALVAIPVGLGLSYDLRSIGLTPYVVATVFPFARVDFSDFRSNALLGPAPIPIETPVASQGQSGFGGLAIETGLSYSLYVPLELPASLMASYRWQRIAPGAFEDEVHQGTVGFFWHFLDAL